MSALDGLLLATFILLQLADVWTTLQVLKRGGAEANPLVRYFIEHYGAKEALLGLKLAVLLFIAAVWQHVTQGLLVFLDVFYALVVWSNYQVMRGRPSLLERLKN